MKAPRRPALLLALALAAPAAAGAGTLVGFRDAVELRGVNRDSVFDADEGSSAPVSARQELRLGWDGGGVHVKATGVLEEQRGETVAKPVVNELYRDGAALGLDWTLGKKVLTWGVGHAFRPLDVVQREDRRALDRRDLVGVPVAAAGRFTQDSATTLVVLNRATFDAGRLKPGTTEVAAKRYDLWAGWDNHLVFGFSEERGWRVGDGAARTLGDEWEVHAEGLWQTGCRQGVNRLVGSAGPRLATSDTWTDRDVGACGKLLAGTSWSGENRLSVLVEAWHDGEGYTLGEWRALRNLGEAQRALLGRPGVPADAVYRNLDSGRHFFEQPTLLKDNLLLRLSADGERVDPSFDLLCTPADGGLVGTFAVEVELAQHLRLFASARWLTGRAGSAYREAPDRFYALLGLEGEVGR